MASGEGSNFEALARACSSGWATIALLVVNNAGCGAQTRAERLANDAAQQARIAR